MALRAAYRNALTAERSALALARKYQSTGHLHRDLENYPAKLRQPPPTSRRASSARPLYESQSTRSLRPTTTARESEELAFYHAQVRAFSAMRLDEVAASPRSRDRSLERFRPPPVQIPSDLETRCVYLS